MVDKTASGRKLFSVFILLSFASQKNDMLLRNMIYLLNANMIGSTASNMICLPAANVISEFLTGPWWQGCSFEVRGR